MWRIYSNPDPQGWNNGIEPTETKQNNGIETKTKQTNGIEPKETKQNNENQIEQRIEI
jgi:hypothetical protein